MCGCLFLNHKSQASAPLCWPTTRCSPAKDWATSPILWKTICGSWVCFFVFFRLLLSFFLFFSSLSFFLFCCSVCLFANCLFVYLFICLFIYFKTPHPSELSLEKCGLQDIAGRALLDALQYNKSIVAVQIDNNKKLGENLYFFKRKFNAFWSISPALFVFLFF